MNITSAMAMVPAKAQTEKPMELGYLDLLALVQSLRPPSPAVSVDDARARRQEFLAYHRRKEKAVPLARAIMTMMEARERVRQEKKAEEEEEEADLADEVISRLRSALIDGITSVAKTIMRSAMVVMRWVGAMAFQLVRGAIMLLVANPWVALAAGVIAIGIGGYYYYKRKKGEKQGVGGLVKDESSPKPEAPISSARVATPSPTGVSTPVSTSTSPSTPVQAPVSVAPQAAAKPQPSANNSSASEASTGAKKKGKEKKAAVISKSVSDAIGNASKVVGVPVTLLTALAGVESSFGANTVAKTSSARGVFQFVKGTWALMVKQYGKQYGVPANASSDDDNYSAIMAAAMIKHKGYPAVAKIVSQPSITDIYLTHFLGASGGVRFLKGYTQTPDSDASSFATPEHVKANFEIFNNGATPRSAKQVYDLFAQRLQAQLNKGAAIVEAANKSKDQPVTAQAPAEKPASTQTASAANAPVGAPQTTTGNSEIIKQGNQRVKVNV